MAISDFWADQIQIKHRVKNVGTTSMTLEYIVVCDRATDVFVPDGFR